MRKIAIPALMLLAMVAAVAQSSASHASHWQLTDSETLWTGRYSNCQYGYFLLLPIGVVAHAEHPPNPHHGFLVKLPEVAVRDEVTFDNSDRLVWVNAEYNATEHSTLNGVADYQIELTGEEKQSFRVLERGPATLQSRPAIRFKAEYDIPKSRVIEEVLVALRTGVVYELGLHTTEEHYAVDRETFRRLIAGFRFTPVPKGQCWNE
jgi:hypothetical protein